MIGFDDPGYLTKKYTLIGSVMNVIYLGIVSFIFTPVLSVAVPGLSIDGAFLLVFLLGLIIAVGRAVVRDSRLHLREESLQAFAAANELAIDTVDGTTKIRPFQDIALLELHGVREPMFRHVLRGKDWIYAELEYKVYRKLKNGDYHAATVYYGIMSAELPRELPNIFFDSKKARGRQFRFHFHKSQMHQLEGDFSKYFSVYFPPEYSVDSLAIITPDVMLALKAAAAYDIELIGNRIFLYGPLYKVDLQLPDMVTHVLAIRKELMDNILTYRDERLPYEHGRQRVAPMGASLRRSPFWTYVSIAVAVLYVLLMIADAIWD